MGDHPSPEGGVYGNSATLRSSHHGGGDEGSAAVDDGNEANTLLLELQDAFVQALSASGGLGKIRAQLRAAAVGLLRADPEMQTAALGKTRPPSEMPLVTQVSLLLVRDFLATMDLQETSGVFLAESGGALVSEEAHGLVRDRMRGNAALPTHAGGGSLLEALAASVLHTDNDGANAPHEKSNVHHTPSSAEEGEASPMAALVPEVAVPPTQGLEGAENELAVAAPQEPTEEAVREPGTHDVVEEEVGVRQYLEAYEESIPYSDEEGPMDDDKCDEIEVL